MEKQKRINLDLDLDTLDALAPVIDDTEKEPSVLELFSAWCDEFLAEQEREGK